ncbi:MAG: tripartite tricarboxylate transporter substrate binding protein [Burkholderiales bacterium]
MRITHWKELSFLILAAAASQAIAADYPSRPIRMLAGFTAGGGSDLAARMVAQKLTEALGQSVVVDNRTGATGAIAAEMLKNANPDGYTLMMLAVAQLVATAYDERLPYDVVRDYAGVSYVSRNPYVMAVNPALPARTVREFIDLAKSQPGKLNYGSTGIGGSNHIVTELFNVAAGIKVTHVPYKGPPQALGDLAGGQVQLVFASITSGMSLARAGKVRAMAVTSLKRSAAAPDVPAIAETLPGFETIGWYGVVAPKKTPAALVQRLSQAIAKGLQSPEIKERLAADGSEAVGSTPAEFDRHMANEVARFKKVIKDAGIRRE